MENNLDKLFKSKLEGQEPEFHPAAWDRMEALLDEEGFVPLPKRKSRKRIILIVLFLLMGIVFSTIGFLNMEPNQPRIEGSNFVGVSDARNNTNPTIKDHRKLEKSELSHPSTIDEEQHDLTLKTLSNVPRSNDLLEGNSFGESDFKHTTANTRGNVKLAPKVNAKSLPVMSSVSTKPTEQFPKDKEIDFIDLSDESVEVEKHLLQSKEEMDLKVQNSNGDFPNSSNPLYNWDEINEISPKDFLSITPVKTLFSLGTIESTSTLQLNLNVKVLSQIPLKKSSTLEVGILANGRFNGGMGYAIGPFVSYYLRNGFSIYAGTQFDVQNFDSGPELIVFDKEYSFGSTITERKFSLNSQKSFRVPIVINKSFRYFDLSSGVVMNKVLQSNGGIGLTGDGSVAQQLSVDNELIKPWNFSILVGASMPLTRHLKLDFGIEYRPKNFLDDQTISKNQNTYYPTIGLRYSFFKF